jgi:hypothetical protein
MPSKGGITKGAPFEREMCKELSLWWSNEEDEDIFWRTEGSGARATSMAKKGKKLPFSHGDVTFKNPIGQPFIDMFYISLKRGYSNKLDLISLVDSTAKNLLEEWIEEAHKGCLEANRKFFIIIIRRDRRNSFVVTNFNFWSQIGHPKKRIQVMDVIQNTSWFICSTNEFFSLMTPKHVKNFMKAG